MVSSRLSGLSAAWGLLALATALPSGSTATAPRVTIRNGTYYGKHLPSFNQDAFLGMPFAQPPVGDLRFANPVPLFNESWEGERNATEYGYWCYGQNNDAGYNPSEDCLTINVIRPSGYEEQLLPVAAWIYGGGFYAGGSANTKYNLSYIVEQSVAMGKPMMALSMNYRVSAWGFMRSEELVADNSTNMGMRDQRLALHWVQENIAAFGGDPTKVTIWGESAGAYSVAYHLVAYGGRDDGLFRGAIQESGHALFLQKQSWPQSQPYYNNLTEWTNCTGASDTLACIRAVPVDILDEILTRTWNRRFYPQPDGDFIEGSTFQQLHDGAFVKVPLINGANSDEGSAFAPYGTYNTDKNLTDYIMGTGPDAATAQTLLELYPDIPAIGIPATVTERPNSTIGLQYKRAAAYDGDYRFIAGRRLMSQIWSQNDLPTWSYRFNTFRYSSREDFKAVTHAMEMPFVFGIKEGGGYTPNPIEGMPQSYYELSDLMSRMWISFVVDGDPNGHGMDAVEWSTYDATDGYGENYVFDANTTSYVEPDTFRAEGIAYINSKWAEQYGY